MKSSTRNNVYLEKEDIDKMIDSSLYVRDSLLIHLLQYCSVSEALGIDLNQIDLINYTIAVKQIKKIYRLICPQCNKGARQNSKFCDQCGAGLTSVNKNISELTKNRYLKLDQATINVLKEFIDRGGPKKVNNKMMLFSITRQYAWEIVANRAKQVGLPDIINAQTGKTHHISPQKLRDIFP